MPGRDRTGPRGEGPMTGWGDGDCRSEDVPRKPSRPRGRARGRGWGGWGRGRAGRGRGVQRRVRGGRGEVTD
jgi:hypothetical protein